MISSVPQQVKGCFFLLVIMVGVHFFSAMNPFFEKIPPFSEPGEGKLIVEIKGDILSPGIYYLPEIITAREVVSLFDPSSGKKNTSPATEKINNGSVYEYKGGKLFFVGELSAKDKLALGFKLDINRIEVEDLKLIPFLSEKMAESIIDYRNERGRITDLEEIMAVKGIKEKRLENIKRFLHVSPL